MDYKRYLPVLKWRMGEYQALMRLGSVIKKSIYPLFVVPPIEYDFDTKMPVKSAQDHIEPLIGRIEKKWGKGLASIELHESLHNEVMNDGKVVPEYVFEKLLLSSTSIQPVIHLSYNELYIKAAITYIERKGCGLVIRIGFESLADDELMLNLTKWIDVYSLNRANIDLVVDYSGDADYSSIERLASITSMLILQIDDFNSYRSIYLVGTSLDFSVVPPKSLITQSREDWNFYKYFYQANASIIKNLGFGDYSIETPQFAPALDMRVIKPAARIIYSTEREWAISKGTAFRDNPAQMHDLCDYFVCKSGYFMNKDMSAGDMKIYECGKRLCGNGSLTTWKEAGTSHHLSFTVHSLASFHEK